MEIKKATKINDCPFVKVTSWHFTARLLSFSISERLLLIYPGIRTGPPILNDSL